MKQAGTRSDLIPAHDEGTAAAARWLQLRVEAEQQGRQVVGEPEAGAFLAVLGRLLATTGLVVTSPDEPGRVLARWGAVPRGVAALLNPRGNWRRRPLACGRLALGWLWVKGGAWESDAGRLAFLEAAATLLATTLQNAVTLQHERDQRALAETLQHLSAALTSSLELEDVLAQVLDELASLVPYDSATVMLLEDEVLRLHAQRGFGRRDDESGVVFIPDQTPGITEVLASDRPVIFADVQDVPGWIWVPGSAHVRSWMGVPLRVQGRVIGMFSIDKSEPDFFTQRHIALGAALAPHAAIAIERARLVQDLRSAEAQLRGLSARVIEAQEAERQRIGQELHDHAGQALLALRAEMQILARQIPAAAEGAQAQVAKIDDILRSTARDLRLLSHELHSHLLDEFGLGSALQQQVRDFAVRFDIDAEFSIQGDGTRRRPRIVELAALRIVQEALTNVARHARAHSVWVRLSDLPGRLEVSIQDDGCGFDYDGHGWQGCFGLIGMRERATAANGSLRIWSQPGEGTRISAEFPDS